MSLTNLLTLATLIALHLPGILHSQNDELDSISQIVYDELTGARNGKSVADLYYERRGHIRYDLTLFKNTIEHFLGTGQYETATELLKVNPFLMSQHNELAMYHYYKAVSQMLTEEGWFEFKEAEKSMKNAVTELKRSWAPDYGFFSDVENARGYLSITARGLSKDSLRQDVCLVRWEYIYLAIERFRDALIYNPENEIAQQNLDTLLHMLEEHGKPIPAHHFESNVIGRTGVSVDSLDIDSLNDVSTIPVLDYSLLPRNHALILRELHRYDEIILLVDLSGSMDDPVGWSAEASKFSIAHQLAIYIAINLRPNVFLGAVSVGRNCDVTSMVLNHPIGSVSRFELTQKISSMRPRGHTPLDRRLLMTKDMFSDKQNKKLVFLLSDGMDTCGDIPDLCGTASILASNGIDLSVFSFIYETLDAESRSAYAIYQCMVRPTTNKIYKIEEDGGVEDDIDYEPVSNNVLRIPPMDTSILWNNNPILFQFPIDGMEPPLDQILILGGQDKN